MKYDLKESITSFKQVNWDQVKKRVGVMSQNYIVKIIKSVVLNIYLVV